VLSVSLNGVDVDEMSEDEQNEMRESCIRELIRHSSGGLLRRLIRAIRFIRRLLRSLGASRLARDTVSTEAVVELEPDMTMVTIDEAAVLINGAIAIGNFSINATQEGVVSTVLVTEPAVITTPAPAEQPTAAPSIAPTSPASDAPGGGELAKSSSRAADPDDDGLSAGALAGVVICVMLVVVAAAAYALKCGKRAPDSGKIEPAPDVEASAGHSHATAEAWGGGAVGADSRPQQLATAQQDGIPSAGSASVAEGEQAGADSDAVETAALAARPAAARSLRVTQARESKTLDFRDAEDEKPAATALPPVSRGARRAGSFA